MHEFQGDLLIGGERLKCVHGELEEEVPQAGSHLLETDRPYRLQLDDGRAGQVFVSRIAPDGKPNELLVDFLPKK